MAAPTHDEQMLPLEKAIEVYPNPSNDVFHAVYKGHFNYSIKNSVGIEVENGSGEDKALVGDHISSPGVYILQVVSPLGKPGNKKVKLIRR